MNSQDSSQTIQKALIKEYYTDLLSNKNRKKQPKCPNNLLLGYSDITVWFFQKNCQSSLEEANNIWKSLPETPLQKQSAEVYFSAYSNRIIEA
mmetsp:Transcript_29776/g.27250  ORF Transcript_29776/g.27250 Transcript_29776/m.27250 type:complete len:93 (+) Transcript_29776:105-383(+)|eukprot:CAMPEP_0114586492 /NCGR_PEP_ID=MMETSP0125-20121206/9698_1 /TAXON_ID=485358 ORGANISM="Aristerostoma sp., Strain ATCC 50986" /NCGR_SAMPLE_ID=MMETSP0125 /ASSEMBLY_ACC=CAM_ASM_000245 /LENGTH=92 /DNA_ID=CAMNT_0001781949 /DNA_START=78 /DNA_END=356 /DNA_ORIENTATION=+